MEYTITELAGLAIDTIARNFPAAKLPPEGHFHYHQGVFLSGVEKFSEASGKEEYFPYIQSWVDAMISPDGEPYCFNPGALDDLQPGILLFGLLQRTHNEKYQHLLERLTSLLPNWDKNEEGGYFHMTGMNDQMWLDGLYMAGPLAVRYGVEQQKPEFITSAFHQMRLMYHHCLKKESNLLLHGWDCSKKAEWANPDTGCAPEIWGRAMGWFLVGGLDMLELLPKKHEERVWAEKVIAELAASVLKYQDSQTGLWYQVVDKPNQTGNWHEVSCSMLFTCAVLRCIRLGLLPQETMRQAIQGIRGVLSCVRIENENTFLLNRICVGTGIGSYDYYIARETSTNDLHGMGAYLLLCAEAVKVTKDKFAVGQEK